MGHAALNGVNMAPGNGTEFYVGQEKAERRLKRPQNRSNDPSTQSLYFKTR
jgi:hypothetical protein